MWLYQNQSIYVFPIATATNLNRYIKFLVKIFVPKTENGNVNQFSVQMGYKNSNSKLKAVNFLVKAYLKDKASVECKDKLAKLADEYGPEKVTNGNKL